MCFIEDESSFLFESIENESIFYFSSLYLKNLKMVVKHMYKS
jgi:hypothetical protein